jgi:hypothetical protein
MLVPSVAFACTRFSAIDPKFVPKFSHRHLLVGVKANCNDSEYSPACPAPECEELMESNDALLLCSAPSSLRWRHHFFIALSKEPDRLRTDPPLRDYPVSTLTAVLESRQIPTDGQFHTLATSQTRIGWLCLFRGFWSLEWLQEHLHRQVTRFVITHSHKLWMLRNQERHGVTPAEREACLRITVKRELDRLYNSSCHCEPHTRTMYFPTVAAHKLNLLYEIRNWIVMYEDVIRISCARQLEIPVPPSVP